MSDQRLSEDAAVQASSSQPANRATPPTAVIAPIQRRPVRLSKYKLPENTTVPVTNSQPAQVVLAAFHLPAAQPAAISANAWYIW